MTRRYLEKYPPDHENAMPKKASSAARQARSSQRKHIQNIAVRSRVRTGMRRFRELLAKDPVQAKICGRQVISWLDRAAKSNAIHRNNARRHKTTVLARINALAR